MVLVCQDLNLHVKIWAWCYWLRNLRPKNQAEVIMQIIAVLHAKSALRPLKNADVVRRFAPFFVESVRFWGHREGKRRLLHCGPIALLCWANRSGPGGSHPLFRINTPLGLSEAWANTFHAAHAHQSPCYTGRPSSHFFFSEGGWVVVEVCPPV